jgi:hypothetical protein
VFNLVRNFSVFAIKVRFLNGSAVFINLWIRVRFHIPTFAVWVAILYSITGLIVKLVMLVIMKFHLINFRIVKGYHVASAITKFTILLIKITLIQAIPLMFHYSIAVLYFITFNAIILILIIQSLV